MKSKKIIASAMMMMFGASVVMTGCGSINSDATLITIDGANTVTLGYGNFAARYQQTIYDQYLMGYYGESMWSQDMSGEGSTLEQDVKADVITTIEDEYLTKQHAAEYSVEITDEDKAAMEKAADDFIAANPEETIKTLGATKEYIVSYLENRTIYNRVMKAVKESADVEVTEDECWQRTFSYVTFSTAATTDADGNTVELTAEELKTLEENADTLSKSDDFDATVEALGLTASTYTYTKGDTEDTFEAAVIEAVEKMTKDGQVSSVIRVDEKGLYVVRLDADHDADKSASKKETLLNNKQSEYFEEVLSGWREAVSFEVNEKEWDKVKFDTLFSTLETESEDATGEAE